MLINGQHFNCKFEKVYINGIIKRIVEATILVNNAIIELLSNCTNTSQLLNGSYLIQFEQCNLRLSGEATSSHRRFNTGHTANGKCENFNFTTQRQDAAYITPKQIRDLKNPPIWITRMSCNHPT